jgi:hypothetical protein
MFIIVIILLSLLELDNFYIVQILNFLETYNSQLQSSCD